MGKKSKNNRNKTSPKKANPAPDSTAVGRSTLKEPVIEIVQEIEIQQEFQPAEIISDSKNIDTEIVELEKVSKESLVDCALGTSPSVSVSILNSICEQESETLSIAKFSEDILEQEALAALRDVAKNHERFVRFRDPELAGLGVSIADSDTLKCGENVDVEFKQSLQESKTEMDPDSVLKIIDGPQFLSSEDLVLDDSSKDSVQENLKTIMILLPRYLLKNPIALFKSMVLVLILWLPLLLFGFPVACVFSVALLFSKSIKDRTVTVIGDIEKSLRSLLQQ